jgi:hypothetical protein
MNRESLIMIKTEENFHICSYLVRIDNEKPNMSNQGSEGFDKAL